MFFVIRPLRAGHKSGRVGSIFFLIRWVRSVSIVGSCGSTWMIQNVTLNVIAKFTFSELPALIMSELRGWHSRLHCAYSGNLVDCCQTLFELCLDGVWL